MSGIVLAQEAAFERLFVCLRRARLEFEFRVRLRLPADGIVKIIHALTVEQVLITSLPIVGAAVILMLS